jgi:hypothetical protein
VRVLSGQAKIASLKEKISEARNEARNAAIASFLGFVIAIVGFSMYFFFLIGVGGWGNILMGVLGTATFLFATVAEYRAIASKNKLLRELERNVSTK